MTVEIRIWIEMPFWLNCPNNFSFQRIVNNSQITFAIKQDLWKIFKVGKNGNVQLRIEKEIHIIDHNTMNLKGSKDLAKDIFHSKKQTNCFPQKLRSILEIQFLSQDAKDNDPESRVFEYFLEGNEGYQLWERIQVEVNRFLYLHAHLFARAERGVFHSISLPPNYYNPDNTWIFFNCHEPDRWVYLYEHPLILMNYSTFPLELFSQNELEGLKNRCEEKEHNFQAHELILTQVYNAKYIQDIHSLMIYLRALIELAVSWYLGHILNQDPDHVDSLLEKNGLIPTIRQEISPHLNDMSETIIQDTYEIINEANLIMHRRHVLEDPKKYFPKCDNALLFIKKIDPELSKLVSTRKIIAGVMRQKHPKLAKVFQLYPPQSFLQAEFIRLFEKEVPFESIRDLVNEKYDLSQYSEISLEGFQSTTKVKAFLKEQEILIFFWPSVTMLTLMQEMISQVIQKLHSDNGSFSRVRVVLLYAQFPPKNRKSFQKFLNSLPEKMKLNCSIEIEDVHLAFFGPNDEPFNSLIRLFQAEKFKEVPFQKIVETLRRVDPAFELEYLDFLYQGYLIRNEQNKTYSLHPKLIELIHKR